MRDADFRDTKTTYTTYTWPGGGTGIKTASLITLKQGMLLSNPPRDRIIGMQTTDLFVKEGQSMLVQVDFTAPDPLVAKGMPLFKSLPGVERVALDILRDEVIFRVQGNNLSIDNIEAIVGAEWQLVDLFPDRTFEVRIRDRFDCAATP